VGALIDKEAKLHRLIRTKILASSLEAIAFAGSSGRSQFVKQGGCDYFNEVESGSAAWPSWPELVEGMPHLETPAA